MIPGKKEFRIKGYDEFRNAWLIELSERAEKGRANAQLLEELKRIFKQEARIVSGERSRLKIVEIENISENCAEKLLRELHLLDLSKKTLKRSAERESSSKTD